MRNYSQVLDRMQGAVDRSRRSLEEVTLIAVTKTHPPETVEEALRSGIIHIGENKVQEALAKKFVIGEKGIWHLIGHLQSNKVKKAVEIFDRIDSVDSIDLAAEISKRCEPIGKKMRVLMEVNVSGEGSKFGVKPEKALELAEQMNAQSNLEITGLMTMAPFFQEVERTRPYFSRLRELRDDIQTRTGIQLPDLSMGMSHDFEIAIEEGSTLIRVGTALFGSRPKPLETSI